MAEKIHFTLNGIKRSVDMPPETMLIEVIRYQLSLTGTKKGCDNATCGTCMVLVNGTAVKSCNLPVANVAGAEIITIEGLAKGMELHPVQKAIAESGAVQCGFCTPGIIITLVGLLERNPNASERELENALNRHLCRCTGYEPIREGALIAQQLIKQRQA